MLSNYLVFLVLYVVHGHVVIDVFTNLRGSSPQHKDNNMILTFDETDIKRLLEQYIDEDFDGVNREEIGIRLCYSEHDGVYAEVDLT